jgi:hypothetical protein
VLIAKKGTGRYSEEMTQVKEKYFSPLLYVFVPYSVPYP